MLTPFLIVAALLLLVELHRLYLRGGGTCLGCGGRGDHRDGCPLKR